MLKLVHSQRHEGLVAGLDGLFSLLDQPPRKLAL